MMTSCGQLDLYMSKFYVFSTFRVTETISLPESTMESENVNCLHNTL